MIPVLYYSPNCPYCRKVLDFINKNEERIYIKYADVTNPKYREDLNNLSGGKRTVPAIYINEDGKNKLLYESDRIVEYLDEKFPKHNKSDYY